MKSVYSKTKLICYFMFLITTGCDNSSNTGQDPTHHIPQAVISDTTTVNSQKDSEPKNTETYPLLIIENNGILWPQSCDDISSLDKEAYLDSIRQYFNQEPVISIGSKGLQQQQFAGCFCMAGECGNDQVAFKPAHTEYLGVMAPKRILQDHEVALLFHEADTSIANRYKRTLSETLSLMASSVYTDSSNQFILFVGASGYIQENQWPLYTSIYWTIIEKESNRQIEKSWYESNLESTNLPIPLAVFTADSTKKIIWYHGEGICCPSFSSAWITEVVTSANATITKESRRYPGGLGQPCD